MPFGNPDVCPQVGVTDGSEWQDEARVFVYLLREDQRVRFLLRLAPDEMCNAVLSLLLLNIIIIFIIVDYYFYTKRLSYHLALQNFEGTLQKKNYKR
jgi:hypothetical protein